MDNVLMFNTKLGDIEISTDNDNDICIAIIGDDNDIVRYLNQDQITQLRDYLNQILGDENG